MALRRLSLRVSLSRVLLERMPIKIGIDLLRDDQMLQLLQPREPSEEEHFLSQSYSLEDFAQLTRAKLSRPATPELRQVAAYLIERGAITAVVAARLAKRDGAAVKNLPDDAGNFANAIVLLVVTDVEDLVVHRLAR